MARILIIDDEPLVRFTLRRILERCGHEITEAETGKLGVEAHRREPADLILMDIVMSGMDGYGAIRKFVGEFPDVKIVAMSGGGRTHNRNSLEAAKSVGALMTISKPFRSAPLLAIVSELLANGPN